MGDAGGAVDKRAHAIGWFAVVVFAYYYKAVLVGFMGGVLGMEYLGGTLIHGISTNHWIEIIIYCPLLWLALHQINDNVFDLDRGPAHDRRANARRRLIGEFSIALVIYGTGVHIANVIEIYSFGEMQLSPYFVMEYVPGTNVANWLDDGIIEDRMPPISLRMVRAGSADSSASAGPGSWK